MTEVGSGSNPGPNGHAHPSSATGIYTAENVVQNNSVSQLGN